MVVLENVLLRDYTTLGVGGPARYFVEARDEEDVPRGVEIAARHQMPLFVLGAGSNLLVSDAGFPGVILRLATRGREALSGSSFRVAAGEDWDEFVADCVKRGLGGIECLSGIPGTVGGTPVQNVGAYGQEVSSVIDRVRAFDRQTGSIVDFDNPQCGFSYRASRFNTVDRDRFIILTVDYRLAPHAAPNVEYRDVARHFEASGAEPTLASVRDAVLEIRGGKAMVLVPGDPDCRSAGSFFKNPVVDESRFEAIETLAGPGVPRFPAGPGQVKVPAAYLIEKAGFTRGTTRGRAGISSRHTLALTNRGGATAAEILQLAREIRDGVKDKFNIDLQPEPVLLGFVEEF
jgi:UDP-N-acetylmuramate dehydrogenase